jgi:hypothetical protein
VKVIGSRVIPVETRFTSRVSKGTDRVSFPILALIGISQMEAMLVKTTGVLSI